MPQLLPAFHNTDDGSLSLVLPVLGHTFKGLFLLFFRFFELDLVDFDAKLGLREVPVHAEVICREDVFPLRLLLEDAVFSTREGLEGAD